MSRRVAGRYLDVDHRVRRAVPNGVVLLECLEGPLPIRVDEVRAMAAENLHDRFTLPAPVDTDIDDVMTAGDLRLIPAKVMAFHGPALQAPQDVFDAAAMNAFGVDLSYALLSFERRELPVCDASAFERLDRSLRISLIVDHRHDSVCQVGSACPL